MNDAKNTQSILLVCNDAVQRDFIVSTLRPVASMVCTGDDPPLISNALIENRFALALLDVTFLSDGGQAAIDLIRETKPPGDAVPILTLAAPSCGAAVPTGADDIIELPCEPSVLLAAVQYWLACDDSLARLAALFGEARLHDLLARLRGQLAEATLRIEEVDGGMRAHKLGGLAGTLGFADVAAAWLDLSEGRDSARREAEASAARALRQIDRYLAKRDAD